jgi:putative RNA 2'-phosphotransferase
MDRKTRQRHEALARFLEYLLGRSPDEFGLVLNPEGWIDLKQVIQVCSEERDWKGTNQARIKDLVWALPDCPLEFDEKRVRLKPECAGASHAPVREGSNPPKILYYGCRRRPYRTYMSEGIGGLDGKEFVLCRTKEMAIRIAKRREPKPILVEVDTQEALSTGTRFLAYGDHLFLVEWLAAEVLSGPPPKEKEMPEKKAPKDKKSRPEEPFAQAPHPDSFRSKPWIPGADRPLVRTPEEEREALKRERAGKRVGWKEEVRKGRRRK